MMVVQARDDGVSPGVDDLFAITRSQRIADLGDSLFHPYVDDPAIQTVCLLDQHGEQSFSATRRSTSAL